MTTNKPPPHSFDSTLTSAAGLPQGTDTDEQLVCERCDEPIPEQVCTHRDLCEACLWCCYACAVEFAESLAYDDDRSEGW